jgi:hypothetical protein
VLRPKNIFVPKMRARDKSEAINSMREVNQMESATRLEITFKSSETITYEKDQWDDYGYDGKSICVKLQGAWVGIYNFDHVFSVELKP